MAKTLVIHPENPQQRLINQAVDALKKGEVIVYPTDSCYALACRLADSKAIEKIRRIRQLDAKHHFTLMCANIAQLGRFLLMDNVAFRLIKRITPGPYTFILPASRNVPKHLSRVKRKQFGCRIPNHPIAIALVEAMDEPLLSTSLIMPGALLPLTESYDIQDKLNNQVSIIIDAGLGETHETTVIEWESDLPLIVREGLGDVDIL